MKYLFLPLLICISLSASAQYIPFGFWKTSGTTVYYDSLVVYYAFTDTTDNHKGLYPISKFNSQGVFRDTAIGIIGKAARFQSDSSQYLQASNVNLSTKGASWSFSFWARAYKSHIGGLMVLGQTFGVCSYSIYDVNNEFRLYNNGTLSVNALTPPNTNYTLYTATYNAIDDSVRFYENASFVGAASYTSINIFTILTFGAWFNGSTPFFGAIDEFYYWRGLTLSQSFITWYYNSGSARTYTEVTTYSGA